MAQNPSRLEENVAQLMLEKKGLVLLKEKVARRGDRGKHGWLQNAEGKIHEIEETGKNVADPKEGSNSKSLNDRMRLNNKVIKLLEDVKILITLGSAPSESVETLLREIATEKPKRFSSGDLINFTSSFSHKIGSGAFGEIFKGRNPDGVDIAVKVLFEKDITEEVFMSEVSTTGKISHPNLAKFYGFCFEEGTKALVYEYMENGSLDKILYENKFDLDWGKLYRIAIETARGLSYLHEYCDEHIIHHDIKPTNILLDSNHSAKITDFGLAKSMKRDVSHRTNTRTRGTPGYAAPENWIPSSPLTPKCDVYSYGILLFEILKRGHNNHNRTWFPKQVWEKFHVDQLDEIIKDCDISEKNRYNARTLCMVALWCIQYTPKVRPSMSKVVMMLEKEIIVTDPPNPFVPLPESRVPLVEERFWKSEQELHQDGNIKKDSTSQNHKSSNAMLESFEKKCPPGGEDSVVVYVTTRPGTVYFGECNEVLSVLRSHHVEVVERDYYSSGDTMLELGKLIGRIVLPALFVRGRFIGGADAVKKMKEDGTLNILFATGE